MTPRNDSEKVEVAVATENLTPETETEAEGSENAADPIVPPETVPETPRAKKEKKDSKKSTNVDSGSAVKVKFNIDLAYKAKKYRKGEVAELLESELGNFLETWYSIV